MKFVKDMNPFTLSFRGSRASLEKEYLNDTIVKSLKRIRVVIILTTFLYGFFGLLDGFMVQNALGVVWIIRYAVVIPCAILMYLLSYGKNFTHHSQLLLFLISYLGAVGIILMIIAAGQSPASSSYYVGLILIIITLTFGFQLLFPWAFFCTFMIVLTYEFGILVYGTLSPQMQLNNQFFFLSSVLVCLAAGYLNEINQRQRYLFSHLLDQEKIKSKEQKKKMEILGSLSGGIVHDLNNMLTSLQGYSELSLHETEKDSPAYSYQEEIFRVTNRAQTMTREILSFLRDESVVLKPVNLRDVFSNVEKYVTPLLKPSIDFSFTIETENKLWSDDNQLHRILMNLCTNSLQAMEERGGRLILVGEETASGEIRIGVNDTGTGILDSDRERIFEPCYTTKGHDSGTGLGLYVVRELVESLKGRLEMRSESGRGTEFSLFFPAAR